jgi:hypothetical protein
MAASRKGFTWGFNQFCGEATNLKAGTQLSEHREASGVLFNLGLALVSAKGFGIESKIGASVPDLMFWIWKLVAGLIWFGHGAR